MSARRIKTIHDRGYQLLVDCLRNEREKAEVTQTQLAELLGVDQSYVSKYERAERRLDVIELRAVCRALGLEFSSFLTKFDRELTRGGL